MNTVPLSLLFAVISFMACAQKQSTDTLRPVRIKGAYLGSVIYPGFKIGVEYPIKTVEKIKVKDLTQKSRLKDHFISLTYGLYHQKTIHTNHWLSVEWGGRRTRSSGFFTDSNMGIGVNRTIIDGTTYDVSYDGRVSKVKAAGYYYVHISMGVGLGYDFQVKNPERSYIIFARTNLMIMYPYSDFIYPRPSIELGGAFSLKNIHTRAITKRKGR